MYVRRLDSGKMEKANHQIKKSKQNQSGGFGLNLR